MARTTPEQRFSMRGVLGVNRIEDARISNPSAPWATKNKYARGEAILAGRPGTKLIVNGKSNPSTGIPGLLVQRAKSAMATTHLSPGATLNPGPPSIFNWVNDLHKSSLTSGMRARAMSSFHQQEKLDSTTLVASRVAGLSRIYFDYGAKRRWVGAYSFEGNADRLFYIAEDAYGGLGLATLVPFDGISSIGGNFHFVPYRYKQDAATDAQSYFAIGTNQLNYPFAVKDGTEVGSLDVEFESLIIGRSDQVSDTPGTDSVADSVKRMYACRAMCVYNGVMVYVGYRMAKGDGTDVELRDHCFTFADLGSPQKLATVDNTVQFFRAGDTEAEECTACGTTVVETDQVGAKNQLVIFTAKRLALFEGIPPSSDAAVAADSMVTFNDVVGCNAPRSVVTCPYGLVFLGTDGVVYLLPRGSRGQVVPISRKIQPVLANMSLQQHVYCAAVWDPDGYYKLSIPGQGSRKGKGKAGFKAKSVLSNINDQQWWADMRNIGEGRDLGVRWFGPMTGMKHSCMARAWGANDYGQILAGSSVDGSIFEINRYELTTDPNPSEPTQKIPFDCSTVTGMIDGGDAHLNKRVTAVSLGVSTNRAVAIEINAVVSGPRSNDEQGETMERVIPPAGATVGLPSVTGSANPFIVGSSKLTPADDVDLFTDEPAGLLMGKMFRFEINEKAPFEVVMDGSDSENGFINFVANSVEYTGTVKAGIYSGQELAAAVQVAMRDEVGGTTITVTYEWDATLDGFVFVIAYSGAGNFQLLFATGGNASEDVNILMGYNDTDHTGATSYESDRLPPASKRARVALSDFSFDVIPSNRQD